MRFLLNCVDTQTHEIIQKLEKKRSKSCLLSIDTPNSFYVRKHLEIVPK